MMAPMKQCPDCEGSGHILLGVHYVSYEMAMDAGDVALMGQEQPEWGGCPRCGNSGQVPDDSTGRV